MRRPTRGGGEGSEGMAAVIDAGQRTNEPATNARRAQAFEIRKIEIADVLDCIAEGVRDFGRAPLYGMMACFSAPSTRSAA